MWREQTSRVSRNSVSFRASMSAEQASRAWNIIVGRGTGPFGVPWWAESKETQTREGIRRKRRSSKQEEIGRNRRRRNGKGKRGWQPRTPTPPRRGPVLGFYVLTSFHSVYESPLRFTTDHRGPFSQRDSTDRIRPKRREKGGSRETTRRSSR